MVEGGGHITEIIRQAIERLTLGVDVLAVAVIVAGVLIVAIERRPVRYVFPL